MKNTIAIQLINVSKEYTIHHEKPMLVTKFFKKAKLLKDEKFLALKNIYLTVRKGERVGIVGANGSGKTTLLKIISGTTTVTSGTVVTKGKISSLIDIEAGFHPDLSGYHNIYINGMIIGMSKKQIENKIKSIIDFADIKQFIDAPFFTYSHGMQLRLGFSIIIHSNPDILLLDEYFAVGDKNFQTKAFKWMKQYIEDNKTMMLVSQSHSMILKYCNRIISLQNGIIKKDSPLTLANNYFSQNHRLSSSEI